MPEHRKLAETGLDECRRRCWIHIRERGATEAVCLSNSVASFVMLNFINGQNLPEKDFHPSVQFPKPRAFNSNCPFFPLPNHETIHPNNQGTTEVKCLLLKLPESTDIVIEQNHPNFLYYFDLLYQSMLVPMKVS